MLDDSLTCDIFGITILKTYVFVMLIIIMLGILDILVMDMSGIMSMFNTDKCILCINVHFGDGHGMLKICFM